MHCGQEETELGWCNTILLPSLPAPQQHGIQYIYAYKLWGLIRIFDLFNLMLQVTLWTGQLSPFYPLAFFNSFCWFTFFLEHTRRAILITLSTPRVCGSAEITACLRFLKTQGNKTPEPCNYSYSCKLGHMLYPRWSFSCCCSRTQHQVPSPSRTCKKPSLPRSAPRRGGVMSHWPRTPVALSPPNLCMAVMALVSSSCVCSCPVTGSGGGRYPNFVSQSCETRRRVNEKKKLRKYRHREWCSEGPLLSMHPESLRALAQWLDLMMSRLFSNLNDCGGGSFYLAWLIPLGAASHNGMM